MHYFSRHVSHMTIIDVVCGSVHANYEGESYLWVQTEEKLWIRCKLTQIFCKLRCNWRCCDAVNMNHNTFALPVQSKLSRSIANEDQAWRVGITSTRLIQIWSGSVALEHLFGNVFRTTNAALSPTMKCRRGWQF